jgi:hypothetical protein
MIALPHSTRRATYSVFFPRYESSFLCFLELRDGRARRAGRDPGRGRWTGSALGIVYFPMLCYTRPADCPPGRPALTASAPRTAALAERCAPGAPARAPRPNEPEKLRQCAGLAFRTRTERGHGRTARRGRRCAERRPAPGSARACRRWYRPAGPGFAGM